MTPPLDPTWVPAPKSEARLDPPETPVVSNTALLDRLSADPASHLDHGFRHNGWHRDRERIYRAIMRSPTSQTRRKAFRRCGLDYLILRHRTDSQRFKIVPQHCHDRLCVPCGGDRRATIQANLAKLISDEPHRFLTLTIRHGPESLEYLVKRLYRCFRRLRQKALWKDRVDGGAAFLEITYTAEHDTWHPHLHVLLQGRYIPKADLGQAWLDVTGDSRNVDIRIVRSKRQVIAYITKYATKPLPPPVLRCYWLLEEAIPVLAGRRTVLTFGSWSRWQVLKKPTDDAWELYDDLDHVQYLAACDDPMARNVVAMLPSAHPHTGEFYVWNDGPAIDDSG